MFNATVHFFVYLRPLLSEKFLPGSCSFFIGIQGSDMDSQANPEFDSLKYMNFLVQSLRVQLLLSTDI